MVKVKEVLQQLHLEYFNDYVTVQKIADDYNIEKDTMITLLEMGAMFHEELVIQNKK
jgi:hypothetical protein